MGRVLTMLGGVLVLALLAGGLAEATLALGHHGKIANDLLLRPSQSPQPTATASPTLVPTPILTPTPIPAGTPSPIATPVVKRAITNSFVHMRAGKSIYTNILVDLNANTAVVLLPDSDAQWQQVQYNGLTGYIFKTYLTY
jgi:hypothetical protein